jgi:hypothetical protein
MIHVSLHLIEQLLQIILSIQLWCMILLKKLLKSLLAYIRLGHNLSKRGIESDLKLIPR